MKSTSILLLSSALVAVATGCMAPKDADGRAHARFTQCSPCHGDSGHGNPVLGAPPIAGLPIWYVKSQLQKFRTGARGTHFDDVGGLKMRPMALALPEGDVAAMAKYVSELPKAPVVTATRIQGDAAKGQAPYATCTACHGVDGSGNESLNAPPIAGQEDWYVLTQLKNFKAGTRGTNAKDATGGTMRAIALTLSDEQMADVAAHVAKLPRK